MYIKHFYQCLFGIYVPITFVYNESRDIENCKQNHVLWLFILLFIEQSRDHWKFKDGRLRYEGARNNRKIICI